MRKRYADIIFPVSSPPVFQGMIISDNNEMILEILEPGDPGYDLSQAEYFPGWIVPGFINAHCHLELSHLKDLIRQGTGLDGFVEELMSLRAAPEEEIQAAMKRSDQELFSGGTVLTGDISNGISSFQVKEVSDIRYHTFVERFGFNSQKAGDAFASGCEVLQALKSCRRNNQGNLSLHAPYSVSHALLELVCHELMKTGGILSIHNQETASEQDLFINGTGKMADRLRRMGFSDSDWTPPHISSIQWLLKEIPAEIRTLLVHNTYTTSDDLEGWRSRDAWFCLCPSANLYIEGRLPDVILFHQSKLNLVIGTDSLASNHQLNILEELKILSRAFPEIQASTILEWACINGARLFGQENLLGTLQPGKQPGLVWISAADPLGKKILPESHAQRI